MSSEERSIQVSSLTKRYEVYASPADRLKQMALPKLRRALHRQPREYFQEFWALRDINLEVRRGETVGIVGRNGSGKSTLLQIICGTLTQTGGTVDVRGRVAALLELGSGFNPEFTGRENAYLNATVLGLAHQEIEASFADMEAFADIGEFIDRPVKTYSSGMYVRLAFSVAINVKPDILVVDEALSVGDEAFQRKCFARIDAIRDTGATVLFVSHSAGVVTQLCDRAVLLDGGELLAEGTPKYVVSRYHKMLYAPPDRAAEVRAAIRGGVEDEAADEQTDAGAQRIAAIDRSDAKLVQRPVAETDTNAPARDEHSQSRGWYEEGMVPKSTVRYETRGARIEEPHVETLHGQQVNVLHPGDEYCYVYRVDFTEAAAAVRCGMMLKTKTGLELGGATSIPSYKTVERVDAGQSVRVRFRFRCLLAGGTYFFNAGVLARVDDAETYVDRLIDAAMFRVLDEPERLATGLVDFCVDVEEASVMPVDAVGV